MSPAGVPTAIICLRASPSSPASATGSRSSLPTAIEFSVSGRYASGVPLDDSNLVVKAREALRRIAGQQGTPPVAIRLEKNLPVASGIGGGSSDAAAVLRGLVRTWGLDIGDAELARIGLSLGADVPMCLAAKPLVARGVGDELSPVPDFPALALVLVNPGVAVSTPDVFDALDKRDNEALPPLPRGFDFHSVRNWLEITRNDLEPAALAIQPRHRQGAFPAEQGRIGIFAHVRLRRDMLRAVRNRQCRQARRRRDPQPRAGLVRRGDAKHRFGGTGWPDLTRAAPSSRCASRC